MASEALSYHHQTRKATPSERESLVPHCLVEFIGTFFLVFTISLSNGDEEHQTSEKAGFILLPPLAIGSVLMVMVFMGGHISGAHYNPAVTLGVYIRGKIRGKKACIYVLTQNLGALTAASVASFITDYAPAPARSDDYTPLAAFCAEVLYTFALVSVVLNVATTAATVDNSFFGFAIGFTVCASAFSVGDISGGALNPAVGTGLLIIRHAHLGTGLQDLWLFWLGPLLGGLLAGMVFRITNLREYVGPIRLGESRSTFAAAGAASGPSGTPLISDHALLSDVDPL